MTTKKPRPIQRDWFSKTLAGLLLGSTLALGCSGLFSHFNMDMPLPIRSQLAMWMVAPIWLGTFSGTFFFSSGRRAWLWLGGANLLIHGMLALARLT